MYRMIIFFVIILTMLSLSACGTTVREIQSKSQSEKVGVFRETKDDKPISMAFAALTIKANFKTPMDGYYVLESKGSLHRKGKYTFIVNVDGQTARWDVVGIRDVKPAYDEEGKTSRAPEAREGIRYNLEKKVLLSAGSHKIFFGLPEEKYSTEVEVSLKAGETGILEFEPIYRTKRIPSRIPTFLKGIDKYKVFLNGRQIS